MANLEIDSVLCQIRLCPSIKSTDTPRRLLAWISRAYDTRGIKKSQGGKPLRKPYSLATCSQNAWMYRQPCVRTSSILKILGAAHTVVVVVVVQLKELQVKQEASLESYKTPLGAATLA